MRDVSLAARRERARSWWRDLQPDPERTEPGARSGDRAALARLRRESDIAAAMADQAVLELYVRLGFDAREAARWLPRVALVALVLAHVREDRADGSAVRAVGRHSFDDADSATMKPLRFRRLLACRGDEELLREMRRMVALADGRRVDVGDLAVSLLHWNDRVRARWAFEYFAAGHAAPATDIPSSDLVHEETNR